MSSPGANKNKLIREGDIWKKSPRGFGVHFWQKRWCILTGSLFAYFKDKTAKEPQGTIQVSTIIAAHCHASKNPARFDIKTANRTYAFKASSSDAAQEWVAAVTSVLDPASKTKKLPVARENSREGSSNSKSNAIADDDDDDDEEDDTDDENMEDIKEEVQLTPLQRQVFSHLLAAAESHPTFHLASMGESTLLTLFPQDAQVIKFLMTGMLGDRLIDTPASPSSSAAAAAALAANTPASPALVGVGSGPASPGLMSLNPLLTPKGQRGSLNSGDTKVSLSTLTSNLSPNGSGSLGSALVPPSPKSSQSFVFGGGSLQSPLALSPLPENSKSPTRDSKNNITLDPKLVRSPTDVKVGTPRSGAHRGSLIKKKDPGAAAAADSKDAKGGDDDDDSDPDDDDDDAHGFEKSTSELDKGDDVSESLEKGLTDGPGAKPVRRIPRKCIPGCRAAVPEESIFSYCPEHYELYSGMLTQVGILAKMTFDAVFATLTATPDAGGAFVARIAAIISADDDSSRGLAVRFLWLVLEWLASRKARATYDAAVAAAAAGASVPVPVAPQAVSIDVLASQFGIHVREQRAAKRLCLPIQNAIIDLLTNDRVTLDIDGSEISCLKKKILIPQLFDTLFAIMEGSPFPQRVITLKSVNALFLQNQHNCEAVRRYPFWQHWLFALLTDLNFGDVFGGSRDIAALEHLTVHANSSVLKQVYAYAMHIISMVHHDAFLNTANPQQFAAVLHSSIDSVIAFGGQNIKTQAIARVLLIAIANKLEHNKLDFPQNSYESHKWANLMAYTAVVKRFVFQTDLWRDDGAPAAGGAAAAAAVAGPAPTASDGKVLKRGGSRYFEKGNENVIDKTRIKPAVLPFEQREEYGVHWTSSGAADIGLLERVLSLYRSLRVDKMEPQTDIPGQTLTKADKDFMIRAMADCALVEDSVAFLQLLSSHSAPDALQLPKLTQQWLSCGSSDERKNKVLKPIWGSEDDIKRVLQQRAAVRKASVLKAPSKTGPKPIKPKA